MTRGIEYGFSVSDRLAETKSETAQHIQPTRRARREYRGPGYRWSGLRWAIQPRPVGSGKPMKAAVMGAEPLRVVESHLRTNGYTVLRGRDRPRWRKSPLRNPTDAVVLAARPLSADGTGGDARNDPEFKNRAEVEVDPALAIATDRWDVIVGEIRNGPSDFNPELRDPQRLRAMLSRVGDVFGASKDDIVGGLLATGRIVTPTAQVRLVAFETFPAVAGAQVRLHEIFWMGNSQVLPTWPSVQQRNLRRPIKATAGIGRWAWTAIATAISQD